VLNPAAARQLLAKCRARAAAGQFSNADNMAVVAVLSTQILYERFIRRHPIIGARVAPQTFVDKVAV
jgi:asparagine synthase (glutamine-hydrolysing)